jgi:hypothetical protein
VAQSDQPAVGDSVGLVGPLAPRRRGDNFDTTIRVCGCGIGVWVRTGSTGRLRRRSAFPPDASDSVPQWSAALPAKCGTREPAAAAAALKLRRGQAAAALLQSRVDGAAVPLAGFRNQTLNAPRVPGLGAISEAAACSARRRFSQCLAMLVKSCLNVMMLSSG